MPCVHPPLPEPRGSRAATTQQCSQGDDELPAQPLHAVPRNVMCISAPIFGYSQITRPQRTSVVGTALASLSGHLIRRASPGSNQGLSSPWKSPEYICSEKDNIHAPLPDSAAPHGCPGQTGDRAISVWAWPCVLIADSLSCLGTAWTGRPVWHENTGSCPICLGCWKSHQAVEGRGHSRRSKFGTLCQILSHFHVGSKTETGLLLPCGCVQ